MKKMKGKVVAGVVAVGMVASMGTAFAATNAGTQMNSWYTKATGTVKSIITGEFGSYYSEQTASHNAAVNSSVDKARQDIRDAGNAELKRANNAVNAEVNAYVADIQGAQSAITTSMPAEYDNFVSTTNQTTDAGIDAIGEANKKFLNSAVKSHTGVYTGRLTTGVEATQEAAAAKLNGQISATKDALDKLLASEKSAATTEITENLQNELKALKEELAALQETGVTNAKTTITDLGAKLEQAAKDELSDIVTGITSPVSQQ
ncbi:hypothetical protein [Paenibacillus xanthanilyticus]|uniref:Uncharacterized protein n=1 Tax=Paenibacillus xanthanilyticus TaxID=1783531 RepID=A0ABV8K3Y7_9BACL